MFHLSDSVDSWSRRLEIVLDSLVLLHPMLSHVLSTIQHDVSDFLSAVSEHDHVPSAAVGEGPDDAGSGGEASGFGELDIDLISSQWNVLFWDALLWVVDDVLSITVELGLLDDFLAPELELLCGDELECVEVDEHFFVVDDQDRPLSEGSELVLPSLNHLEGGPLRVPLSEQFDDMHLLVFNW